MAEPGADAALPDDKNEANSRKKSALDTVAPGEEDVDLSERKNDFDRSAMWMASATSGIQRETWGNKTQFLMSCIASAVGLGNVWRFPAICAKNGGATFLIPYVIVLFVIARPLYVLELTLGQFSSKGSVRCWDVCPAFTGIGITGMISSVLLSTFYIMLLAWALIYSVIALVSICYDPKGTPIWTNHTGPFFGGEVIGGLRFNQVSDHFPQSIIPVCHLVLALIFAWMIIWVTMVFGVEASGKVAYVTALAPYGVLLILLIAGLLLPGMQVGLKFLFFPDWKKLVDANTWFQAVGQCFFSLGIGFGGCIMFSSFSTFYNDIIHDVMIIGIVDSVTSLLAGISLMSILGFQATTKYNHAVNNREDNGTYAELYNCANETGVRPKGTNMTQQNQSESVANVMKECALQTIIGEQGGAGLAFVHYPAAMNQINIEWGAPIGTIFGLLFFLMLILLAVGSANGFVGTTVTIIADKKPKWKRSNIVSGVCGGSCILGMIYTNKFGAEWFDVVDTHGVTAVVYVLALLEVAALVYVYGLKNFCDDIEFMRNGKAPGWYLHVTWVLLPILMTIIYMYWLCTYKSPDGWTTPVVAIGWLMTGCCLMIIPGTMVYKFIQFRRNPWRRNVPLTPVRICCGIFDPNPRWGPKDPEIRVGWKEFKAKRDPSFNMMRKMKSFWYRMIGRPEPSVRPAGPSFSYATAAFSTGPKSEQSTAPESGIDPAVSTAPGQKKSNSVIVPSETPNV